ncbi:MAG TPA: NAD(+) synthase [Clostridiales bacterium]|nr:NAD(+) synthase [Clostridiales bacterium]
MKIALAQFNSTVGDLNSNTNEIASFINSAREKGADLVVFPESALTGNPPEGLLDCPDFIKAGRAALNQIISSASGIGVLLSTKMISRKNNNHDHCAVLIENGSINGRLVLNEPGCLKFHGYTIALSVSKGSCEKEYLYARPDVYINLCAENYRFKKMADRVERYSGIACKYGIPFLHVNQVGGNGELVFDGSSMVFDEKGNLVILGKHFSEDLVIFDTDSSYQPLPIPKEDISWVYNALVLGFKDYFHKNGFTKTLLGLSGGIDSALVACIAADALGRENVLGVSMPSRYSSSHSRDDARQLAENLGVEYRVLPIEEPFAAYIRLMNGSNETIGDLAEENIQARIRGSLLMFISNREGRMLVATSNKSEAAVGYSTLYGDMCGGLAPIGDIPKTMVYELCNYINREKEIIPVNTIIKPPSAELRPDQLDQDSLPPYDVLDGIIEMNLDDNLSADEIVSKGYDRELVLKILNMIDRMEYKRRQAAPVLKITSDALIEHRKMPLVQRFRRS